MSKRFRSHLCVYCCSRQSAAPDHIFARSLFVDSQRANLPQVPACQPCNVHAHAARMLQDCVARRLAKNEKLRRELASGAREELRTTEAGETEKRLTLPFENEKLENLFALIVRGVIFHHSRSLCWTSMLFSGRTAQKLIDSARWVRSHASFMGYARKSLVSLQDTPYYHVIARCVRRAWLWGFDEYAGKDYSHRKLWVLERLAQLSSVFAIDVCAYAVLSNHYHLVVHVDQSRARGWTAEQVIGIRGCRTCKTSNSHSLSLSC